MIRFEEITNRNIWNVCTLEPFEEQKDFVAENIQSLAEAYATRNEGNNALPLAVYNDDDLIGFIMIGKGTVGNENESDLIKENYCFWRFMIDKQFQGRGLGKQTMDAAMALIRTFPFGEAKKVWLSYEPENTRAREIYRKYGFVENGEMCGNEIVAVYDLPDTVYKMTFETDRLILRPWEENDAEDLYKYASHPDVGPAAGWAVHTSIENSREIIRDILSAPETYAVVLKESGHPVGSIGLMLGKASNIGLPDSEGEIGYWIGVPYWGQGLIPEAVREIMRYGFENLHLEKIWCGYFDGNTKSKRVQEKCGFLYHHTAENVPCALEGVLQTEHLTCISREEWLSEQSLVPKLWT